MVYTIGQISKLVNISANALRYYDEISLLKPAKYDRFTGYRYYADAQLKTLIRIQEMKYYGFSLNEIRDLLHTDNDQLHQALTVKMRVLKQNYIEDGIRLRIIMKKLGEIDMDKNKLVMLVECVGFERMLMVEILNAHGFTNIVCCTNGKDAVEQYEERLPALVITGITMPIMDGLYASKMIMQKHNDARFIFCTAMSRLNIVFDAIGSGGCVDFIAKPFKAERLINSVIYAFEDDVNEINVKRIGVLSYEINLATEAYKRQLRLNQDEIDAFLSFISKSDTGIDEFKAYLNGLSERYDKVKSMELDGMLSEFDFNKASIKADVESFIAFWKETVNRLISEPEFKYKLYEYSTDFVWKETIVDHITSNKDNRFIEIWNSENWAGGFSFPQEGDFDTRDFVIRLADLASGAHAIRFSESVSNMEIPVNGPFVLSTLLDDKKNVYNLFVRYNMAIC